MCTQDVLPYAKTVSPRDNASFGINTIGLERKGVPKESIEALQRAYRILVRSKLKLDDALQRIESELGSVPEARYLVDFVRASKRGFIR
jgi:UDP-N-acetylglucosamine acyltransferase